MFGRSTSVSRSTENQDGSKCAGLTLEPALDDSQTHPWIGLDEDLEHQRALSMTGEDGL